MKRNKSGLAALLALMLLALPLTAGALTHANQNPADHVTLVGVLNKDTGYYEFKRLDPDGTLHPENFVVPEGKWLIITDIIWENISTDLLISHALSLRLHGAPPESLVTGISWHAKAPGRGGPSQNMTTGVAVKGGGWVTVETSYGRSIFLYGYLSGNQP
jgi:hypothetical protein